MKILAENHFLTDQNGAVTIDMAVLTAGAIGLSVVIFNSIGDGLYELGGEIRLKLSGYIDYAVNYFDSNDDSVTGNGANVEYSNDPGSDGEAGYIHVEDRAGSVSYVEFTEPSGDMSEADAFSYDITQFDDSEQNVSSDSNPDVVIHGTNNESLYSAEDQPVGTDGNWTTNTIPLEEGYWYNDSGNLATQEEIDAVMSDVASTEIRAEQNTSTTSSGSNTEEVGMDNVGFVVEP